jgi:4-aminobutyrate aminotransferase / (S)-3-amino-2-methylpropionate transaminase / 5-aminovalerate transaminase
METLVKMSGLGFTHEPKIVSKVHTKHRVIKTPIPVPESIPLLERLYKSESHSMHGQLPIIWDKADGFQVYDEWGNKWLDFSSTIFVTNAGHGNKRILDALKKVINKPLLHTYTFTSPERISYLEYLIKNTPDQFEKAFLLSAGTEATECALKIMRLHGMKKRKKRGGIICFEGNWHGRTMGAQMMGWNSNQKDWIGYLDPNIYHLPFPYPWRKEAQENPREYFRYHLKELVKEKNIDLENDICGIMMETFQGWGGIFYPTEFVQEVSLFAKEVDSLLVFDEMQSGFARTGELFGYMHYDVEPDLICCGKGASSSLPLSIVLGSKSLLDLPEIGSMSSTHSANPMVCAAGKANLEAILEDGLLENSKDLGLVFHNELDKIKEKYPNFISSIQGKGLLAAVIFSNVKGKPLSKLCDNISELCLQRGLLVVHTGRESIKLAPPLIITKDAMMEGLEVLDNAIKDSIKNYDY